MQLPLVPVHPGAQLSAGAQAKPDISRTIITNFAIDLPRARQERRAAALRRAYCSVTEDTACSTKVCKPRRCVGVPLPRAASSPHGREDSRKSFRFWGSPVEGPSSEHSTDTRLRALARPGDSAGADLSLMSERNLHAQEPHRKRLDEH